MVFVVLVSLGGFALTYLFARNEGLLWRLCAGNIIGSVLFFFPAFFLASFFCLNSAAPWLTVVSLLVVCSPLALMRSKAVKAEFRHERDIARGKVQGASYGKVLRFAYYAFFALLFVAFFGRAMMATAEGIFTGASQNLGDLPFHLGAIFSFSEACNFPPQNPSFAGAKFTYPFTADFLTSVLVALGAEVHNAMWIQNVSWAFSMLVILERFVVKTTGSRLAGRFAAPILFFSGGFGFMWFLGDYRGGVQGLWELMWNLPQDYTIGDEFRWGNSLVTLFITQRSLLLGLPLTLVVLGFLWTSLTRESPANGKSGRRPGISFPTKSAGLKFVAHPLFPYFFVGLLAGTLPLVHAHSLAVLFVVSACWFFFSIDRWKEWIAFGIGVALIAVPELIWILSGSATRTSEFAGWHFGFDARDQNVAWFWIKNTGLFIPLIAAAFLVLMNRPGSGDPIVTDEGTGEIHRSLDAGHDSHRSGEGSGDTIFHSRLVPYYLPFLILFIVSNLFKLAPWEWDNIKVLIYWYAGSVPLVAGMLAWGWEKSRPWKALSAVLLLALVFSGALDVWRTASGQIKNRVFERDAVDVGEWSRFYTEPDAVFLNAPTYNSAVVLSGRISAMRYIGHLSSHGIDYAEREADVKKIYAGAPEAEQLLDKYGIDYVLVSPEERMSMQVNDGYFSRFELVHEEGAFRIFKVRK